VIEWNEERQRFVVRLKCDGSVKYFKPMNLIFDEIPDNDKENNLYNLIYARKVTDLEKGLKLFEEIETEQKYDITYMKIRWLQGSISLKDKRSVSKLLPLLENII